MISFNQPFFIPSSRRRPMGAKFGFAPIRFSPSPDRRLGEGARRADEGPSEARVVPLAPPLRFAARPSSGASRHLLPRKRVGEGEIEAYVSAYGRRPGPIPPRGDCIGRAGMTEIWPQEQSA